MKLRQCKGWRLARLLIEGRATLAVPQVPPRRVRMGEVIGLVSVVAVHFVGNLASGLHLLFFIFRVRAIRKA